MNARDFAKARLWSKPRINIISLDEMRDPADREGSWPLSHEDSQALHVPDYARDTFVPVSKAQTDVEGGGA